MNRNMFLLNIVALTLISCSKDNEDLSSSEIRDGSGNIYNEIIIGDQVWLKEDLRTGKYIDGQVIPESDCINKGKEGVYYSSKMDMAKVCPKGYKVPTRSDYKKLITYFGGEDLNATQIIDSYVTKWNGNANGNGDGNTNNGSGLYWTCSKAKEGYYYFYFRTQIAGMSVDQYSEIFEYHIKCIKI